MCYSQIENVCCSHCDVNNSGGGKHKSGVLKVKWLRTGTDVLSAVHYPALPIDPKEAMDEVSSANWFIITKRMYTHTHTQPSITLTM